jgi:hypothetical protein
MRYLLLLYGNEEAEAALGADGRRAIVAEHMAFARGLATSGALVTSGALGPPVTDGPFAETKEQLGGFYVVDCAGEDEARELAARVPRSPGLVVEIRPVVGVD